MGSWRLSDSGSGCVFVDVITMIPTRYKDKLAKMLSWPVGPKMLSEGLEGVLQYDKLSAVFSADSTFLKSELQKRIQEKKTILVLSVTYRNYKRRSWRSRYGIEHGWYEENWEIAVYPVPREQKPVVREAIKNCGFRAIPEWLTKKRVPSWYDGTKTLSVGFDLGKGELVLRSDDL